MTVAEYMACFLRDNGITKVFAIQGGGSARLIDAIGYTEGIDYVCNQHEQASAMSADGYARASGKIGCALSTSGPGATNLLTGCCGAYFDSIPILFITGQVSSFRKKGDLNVRCMHTQETDVVDIFRPVTKYAVALNDPYKIRYELEKCLYIAMQGRPGPVLIDIPDDYQRAEIEIEELEGYSTDVDENQYTDFEIEDYLLQTINNMILEARRPIIIAGWGVHAACAEREFVDFIESINIPVVCTWAAKDIMPEDNDYKVGTLGMNGSASGNYAIREADLIIVIGARLDQHTIIVSLEDFAPNAKKIYVDIDNAEIMKFKDRGCDLDVIIHADIRDFLNVIGKYELHKSVGTEGWIQKLKDIQKEHVNSIPLLSAKDSIVNPYRFFEAMSEFVEEDAIIFADTGSSLVWTEQYFKVKRGQRIHSSLNNTPMGYALPAAIGAAVATKGRVYSINGDGGLQMNIQELATVIRHNMDIKIILFDNAGYGMVQRTQDTYMCSRYEGTDVASGLAFPDFKKVFDAYGFNTVVVDDDDKCGDKLKAAFDMRGPGCIIVKVSINENYETFHAEDVV